MIVYFLFIFLVNIIYADDISDTKYIETLPATVKKGLLDKVARRILNEVPEVNSHDTDINGDILADRLEEQSEFVKRILKEEIASLRAKRRHHRKLKRFRKSGNDNDELNNLPDSQDIEKNDTHISEWDAKKTVSDKIDADAGHIDLTMRAARSKRDDSFLNENVTTSKDSLTKDEHGSHDGGFVPVTVELDSENDDKEPINKSNKNTTEVFNEQQESDDDIQIRHSKQSEKKQSENTSKKIPDVATEKADSVLETTTKSHLNSETTLKNEDTSAIMHFGRGSEDLNLNETKEIVSTATVDVTTVSDSLNKKSIDTQTLDDYTTSPKIVDITTADVTDSYLQTNEETKNKTDHEPKYSSESYLENPIIDNKGRKYLEVLNSDVTTTQKIEEASLNSSVTEDKQNIFSEITTLITTETPYVATTRNIQTSVDTYTIIAAAVRTDIQKDFEVTNKNSKEENKLAVTEISTKTQTNDASTVALSNSSKIADANDTKINDKKPCNETSSKAGIITDCDKKRNETANSSTEIPNVTETHKIDDEPKLNATGNKITQPKDSLRTGHQKTLYDSLIHFGDMQIKKEYEVFEVDSGKPTFVKQNEKTSIEQPRYAPVYNYDPENAYFNAYNRLGPNEDDADASDATDLGNENVMRSKNIRMSKLGKHHKRKHKDGEDVDGTTEPYYSEEIKCKESKQSKENVKKRKKVKIMLNENDESKKEEFYEPMSYEDDNIDHPYTKNHLSTVRHTNIQDKLFRYVPTHQERKIRLAKEVKYLYNNILGKSTEEILDETNEDKKRYLRINNNGRYNNDASEDKTESTRKVAKDDNEIKVLVIDVNDNGTSILRQGYFSSKYKWDEESNSFTNQGKVYSLDNIVPYSTEKSIIVNQRQESNKILDRIKEFAKPNTGAEFVSQPDPEDAKKAIEHLKNIDKSKTLFNDSSVNEMVKGVQYLANPTPPPPVPPAIPPPPPQVPPAIPPPPRQFQYLKQRLVNSRHQSEMQNTHSTLRRKPCHTPPDCEFRAIGVEKTTKKPMKYKPPNEVLNSIQKITQITPEIDMLQNIEPMLKVGFPIARTREDDLELYVRILRDMVKMDNEALEDYDWLGTTVAVQSALAKLREIIDQKKNGQRVHPFDLQLFKYVEALYTKASEATKEKEGETLDEHIKYLKQDRKVNNERMALPKTHRKIKNPMKLLQQISDLMNKKVLRDKITDKTRNFELFLDCLQRCIDDFHTAIKEITRITKYNQQRWYRNIKELYLSIGERKEYLEVLLHLYSMKLFSLIEESADNGAELNYKMYMNDNRLEVDRAQAEMMFIIRILKTIHDLRAN